MSKRLTFDIPDLAHQCIINQHVAYIELRPKFIRVKMVYDSQPRESDELFKQSWTTCLTRDCAKGYDISRLPSLRLWQVDINNAAGSAMVQLYFTHERKAKKMAAELHKYIFMEDYIDIPVDEKV